MGKNSPIGCKHKESSPENKLDTFIAEAVQENILDHAISAEKILEACPSDFDSSWKIE